MAAGAEMSKPSLSGIARYGDGRGPVKVVTLGIAAKHLGVRKVDLRRLLERAGCQMFGQARRAARLSDLQRLFPGKFRGW